MALRITTDGAQKDIDEIHDALCAFNHAHREACTALPLGIYLETDAGEKQAGLVGEIFGSWLCIHYLWVAESLRGQGTGTQLLAAAEAEAKAHGCKYAFVDTFNFQAPAFYEKHGYKQVFALTEYPVHGKRFYYTKTLT